MLIALLTKLKILIYIKSTFSKIFEIQSIFKLDFKKLKICLCINILKIPKESILIIKINSF